MVVIAAESMVALDWPGAVMLSVLFVSVAAVVWRFLWLMAQEPPTRESRPPSEPPVWESETTADPPKDQERSGK